MRRELSLPQSNISQMNKQNGTSRKSFPSRQISFNNNNKILDSSEMKFVQSKELKSRSIQFNNQNQYSCTTSNFFCRALIYLFLILSLTMAIYLLVFFTRPSYSIVITSTVTTTTITTVTTTTLTTTTSITTTTTSTSSTTTTQFRLRWNATGITVAGITGSSGTGSNQLNFPSGIIVDSTNHLYIADKDNHRIQNCWLTFSNTTTIAGISGTSSSTFAGLSSPRDVAMDSAGNIFVADTSNYRIMYYPVGATNGNLFAGTGSAGSGNNQFNQPSGLSFDSNTNALYVADYNNDRIMRYYSNSSNGTVVASGASPVMTNTPLRLPKGIHFDAASNSIFIANSGAHNVVRWSLNATTWMLVAGLASGAAGSDSASLNSPTDVFVDSLGNVYVADQGNHRIQFFMPGETNGTTIAGTTSGSNANQLTPPESVFVDAQFNVFVADSGNHRVQKFVPF